MIQITYCLKQKIGMIIAACIFGLFGTVSAEEITPLYLYEQSDQGPLKGDLFPKSSSKNFSIGISVEERRPSSLGTWYSKSALEDYDFKFRDMTTAEKADALDAFKAVMDEFEILEGVKETFEGTEETFERYIKKFMLKGDFKFDKEEKATNTAENRSRPKLRGKTSSFLYRVFVPDRVEWNLDASLSNRGVGAEVNLGEYLSVEGDVGEETEAFMMFKLKF